jgi:nitrogen fixation protein FixH
MSGREITGRHVFLIMAGAFAVIIGVNIALAVNAVRTFPGLEVPNSYVASQTFDADRAEQVALGWTASAAVEDGVFKLRFRDRDGNAIEPASVTATLGRATEAAEDQTPELHFDGDAMAAPVTLAPGRWTVRFKATAEDGTLFHQRLEVRIARAE